MVDSDLAAQSELAKDAIFFQAVVLNLSHFWFWRREFDSAGGATGFSSAAVADIDAIFLECEDELGAFLNVKCSKTFCGHLVGRHIAKILPENGVKVGIGKRFATKLVGMVNEERLIGLFKQLCLINAPALEERACMVWTRSLLENMGLEVFEDGAGAEIGGNCGNLIATLRGNKPGAPRIFLSAHFDTVEPTEGLMIEERDGVIYSASDTILGADDKGGMAPIIECCQYFLESGEEHGDIVLLLSVAEEIGLLGAGALKIEDLNVDFGYVFDTGPPVGSFVNRTATHDKMDVTIYGKPAHAGKHPEEGISAIQVAADAISHMKLGRIGPETTANIGLIMGGSAVNVVPPMTKLKCEARSTSVEELDAQIAHMKEEFSAAAARWGADVDFDYKRHYCSYHVDPSSRVIQIAQKAAANLGYDGALRTTLGGSDANQYNAKGVPTIVVATGMEKIHTHDEYISRKELIQTAELAIEIVREAAKG